MSRLLPRSLAAQMALLLGVALLIAQLVNFALILNERQKLSLAQIEGPAITRFASLAADIAAAPPPSRAAIIDDASHRGARFHIEDASNVPPASRDSAIERRLRNALDNVGVGPAAVRGGIVELSWRRYNRRERGQLVRLAVQLPDGQWLTGGIMTPRRDPWLAVRLGLATLVLYFIVLGVTVWIALRLARPLRALTAAAERFGGREPFVPVTPAGPGDLRRAIEAFNAMNGRVLSLLDEKDRMLGAIGHDLRTPLASLRIRIESMEPEEERAAAIAKIAEMTAMMEDILVLARSGRTRDAMQPVDIGALAELVAEEHRDIGDEVTFVESGRHVATVHQGLLRRAIGNLVDNAVKYGGGATVSVEPDGEWLAIRVADQGPGIPAADLDRVRQPFYRLEQSRNRDTGGSGLGLAIATSIAESHGGRLVLEPGKERGLVASILIPTRLPL